MQFHAKAVSLVLAAGVHFASGSSGGDPRGYASYQPQYQQPHQQQQQQWYGQGAVESNTVGVNEETPAEAEGDERPPLPEGWTEHFDPNSGQFYYFNAADGTTTWDRPEIETQEPEPIDEQKDLDPPAPEPKQPEPERQETISSEPTYYGQHPIRPDTDTDSQGGNRGENMPIDRNEVNEYNVESFPQQQLPGNAVEPKLEEKPEHATVDQPPREESRPWESQVQDKGWGMPPTNYEKQAQPHRPEQQGYGRPAPIEPQAQAQEQQAQEQQEQQQPPPSGWGAPKTEVQEKPVWGVEDRRIPSQNQQSQEKPTWRAPDPKQMPPQPQWGPPTPNKPSMNLQQPPTREEPTKPESARPFTPPPSQQQQQQPSLHQQPPQAQGPPRNQNSNQQQPPPPLQQGLPQRPPQQPYGNYGQYGQYGQPNRYSPPAPYKGQGTPQGYGQYGGQQGYKPSSQEASQSSGTVALLNKGVEDGTTAVKSALGTTWQSLVGFGSKTRELTEQVRDQVVTNASAAGQTLSAQSTSIWGKAKNAVGSVFEGGDSDQNVGQQGYSLSGNAGGSPQTQAGRQSQGPPGYPPQYGYPPQRPPPTGSYPPQGGAPSGRPQQGGPQQQIPYQGNRQMQEQWGSAAYPQQGSGQQRPPMQAQYGNYPPQGQRQGPAGAYPSGRGPQGTPPPQRRNPYGGPPPQGQQQQQNRGPPPSQNQQPPSDPWSHPGLSGDM